jgi:hypothetical protein
MQCMNSVANTHCTEACTQCTVHAIDQYHPVSCFAARLILCSPMSYRQYHLRCNALAGGKCNIQRMLLCMLAARRRTTTSPLLHCRQNVSTRFTNRKQHIVHAIDVSWRWVTPANMKRRLGWAVTRRIGWAVDNNRAYCVTVCTLKQTSPHIKHSLHAEASLRVSLDAPMQAVWHCNAPAFMVYKSCGVSALTRFYPQCCTHWALQTRQVCRWTVLRDYLLALLSCHPQRCSSSIPVQICLPACAMCITSFTCDADVCYEVGLNNYITSTLRSNMGYDEI